MNAQELFQYFQECKHLNWSHNNTGCESRADLIAEMAAEKGFEPRKIWFRISPGSEGTFGIYINKSQTELTFCKYHVAVIINFNGEDLIFDPAFFEQPVSQQAWETFLNVRCLEYDYGYQIIESDWRNFYGPEQMIFNREKALKDRAKLLALSNDMDDPTVYYGAVMKARGQWLDEMSSSDPDSFTKINDLPRNGPFGLWLQASTPSKDLFKSLKTKERYFAIPTKLILNTIDFSDRFAVLELRKEYWPYIYDLFKLLSSRRDELLCGLSETIEDENLSLLFKVLWDEEPDEEDYITYSQRWFSSNNECEWDRFGVPYEELLKQYGYIAH